ncbi:MAG: serpin family protein, partial [Xenococcaceae cyanobacterium]
MSQKNILGIFSSIVLLLVLAVSVAEDKFKAFNFASSSPSVADMGLTKAIAKVSNTEEKIAFANNQFSFELFNHVFNPHQQRNVFISPTSIAIALTMTYNGAKGETQSDMASALNLKDLSLKDINTSYQKLQQKWQKADSPVQLSIANSLWAKEGVPFKHQFLKNNRQYYAAQITNLNFSNPGAKNIINSWIKEATQGKIEQFVNDITPEDILLLINAIYFKGNWAKQFDRNLTTVESFQISEHFSKPHPLMSQTGKYRY